MKWEVNSLEDKTYWNQNPAYDLYFKFPLCVYRKKRLTKKKSRGEEREAKLALYSRKHSNLLLITTGPSSSGTPDREEDNSRTKFFHRYSLPTSQLQTSEFICHKQSGGQALHRKHLNDILLPLFT